MDRQGVEAPGGTGSAPALTAMADVISALGATLPGLQSGLVVGFLTGWFGHVLSTRRTDATRRTDQQVLTLDRCSEIFGARARYVLAATSGSPSRADDQSAYMDVWRRWAYARPEVVLDATSEWTNYTAAEHRGGDSALPVAGRMTDLASTSEAVLELLGRRRRTLLGALLPPPD